MTGALLARSLVERFVPALLALLTLALSGCPLGRTELAHGRNCDVHERFQPQDRDRWGLGDWRLGASLLDPRNVEFTRHGLVLSHRHLLRGGALKGAEVFSERRYLHGRWTARMAAPSVNGTICAFFLYFVEGEGEAARTWEIDLELFDGKIQASTYQGWLAADGYGKGPTHRTFRFIPSLDHDPTIFHDYGIDWNPERIVFSLDGLEIHQITDIVPDRALAPRFNHWTSSEWEGLAYPPPPGLRLGCRVAELCGEMSELPGR